MPEGVGGFDVWLEERDEAIRSKTVFEELDGRFMRRELVRGNWSREFRTRSYKFVAGDCLVELGYDEGDQGDERKQDEEELLQHDCKKRRLVWDELRSGGQQFIITATMLFITNGSCFFCWHAQNYNPPGSRIARL